MNFLKAKKKHGYSSVKRKLNGMLEQKLYMYYVPEKCFDCWNS
jgi:hypothetical protein